MAKFSNKEKAAECRRELGKRVHVYGRAVAEQKMKQVDADRLIALMEEMAQEYDARDAMDRPDMFAGGDPENAQSIAELLRGFSKFGETPKRAETMRVAAKLLEEYARKYG